MTLYICTWVARITGKRTRSSMTEGRKFIPMTDSTARHETLLKGRTMMLHVGGPRDRKVMDLQDEYDVMSLDASGTCKIALYRPGGGSRIAVLTALVSAYSCGALGRFWDLATPLVQGPRYDRNRQLRQIVEDSCQAKLELPQIENLLVKTIALYRSMLVKKTVLLIGGPLGRTTVEISIDDTAYDEYLAIGDGSCMFRHKSIKETEWQDFLIKNYANGS